MNKAHATTAKRQRAVEKQQNQDPQQLSDGELHVLAMFRKYLMSPGKMLCFSSQDLTSMKKSVDKLIQAGLLVSEDFKGGYSLTRSGYAAMRKVA